MNNDIWSPREEPLQPGKSVQLKVFHRPMPRIWIQFYFINNRLKRAWMLMVTAPDLGGKRFRAKILKEARYEDALSNN